MTSAVTGHYGGTRGRLSHQAGPAAAGALLSARALAGKPLPLRETISRCSGWGHCALPKGGIHAAWPSEQQL